LIGTRSCLRWHEFGAERGIVTARRSLIVVHRFGRSRTLSRRAAQ
jgi:hypothetical protein